MLKIQCPECNKNFLWTDDMPADGKCPTADCSWQYNIHDQLKQNIDKRETAEIISAKKLLCPSCSEEIVSKFTICRHCGMVVMGAKFFKKTSFFLAICIVLIVLSLILKYVVK
jgi:hypothetical protein